MRNRLAMWLLAANVLAACGEDKPEALGEENLEGVSEAAVAATWKTPSCENTLAPTPGECAGPWQYIEDKVCNGRDASCGKECADHVDCAKWENGVLATAPELSGSGSVDYQMNQTCDRWTGACGSVTYVPAGWSTQFCENQKPNEVAIENAYIAQLNAEDMPAALRAQRTQEIRNAVRVTSKSWTQVLQDNSSPLPPKGKNVAIKYRFNCRWETIKATPVVAENADCPVCQTEQNKICDYDCGDFTKYTAPEAAKPVGAWKHDQVCTTCDELGDADGDGGFADDRLTCYTNALAGTVPASVSEADFKAAIHARAKLLFERHADELSAAERSTVLGIYEQVDAGPTCQVTVAASSACREASHALGDDLHGRLQACVSSLGAHVPAAVRELLWSECVELLTSVDGLDGDCFADYREQITDALRDVLVDRFLRVEKSASGWTGLVESLRDIDEWYEQARTTARGDAYWLLGKTSAVLDAFWSRVHQVGAPVPLSVDATAAEGLLGQLFAQQFAADLAVLDAAFSDPAPIDSAPLVYLLADALEPLVGRLESVSGMHDLACAYRGCGGAYPSSTSQAWRVLAALGDGTLLTDELDASSILRTTQPAFATTLSSIASGHARLDTAWESLGAGALSALGEEPLPLEGELLGTLIQRAQLRWNHYRVAGNFFGGGARELHAGMQKKSYVLQALQQHTGTLTQERNAFHGARMDLVNQILTQLRGEADIVSVLDRLKAIGLEMAQGAADMAGLQAREHLAAADYARYVAIYDLLNKTGVFSSAMEVNTQPLTPLTLRANNARFVPNGPAAMTDLGVLAEGATWKQSLTKGQTLRFGVNGKWAPNCALQKAHFFGPTGDDLTISKSDALAGPEGYTVQWSNGNYDASGWSEDTSKKVFANASVCLSTSIGTPGFVKSLMGSDTKIEFEACVGGEASKTWSDTESGGTQNNSQASFSGGLRLANTPFPTAPAGALLLVATSVGNAADVRDVRVVEQQLVYVAPDAVDLYLVVNDVVRNDCTLRGEALTVEMQKSTPFGAVAIAIRDAMAETAVDFEAEAALLIEQGELMSTDATRIRGEARLRLAEKLTMDINTLPTMVMEVYETWVQAGVASLERRIAIRRLQRQQALLQLQVDGLHHDLTAGQEQSRLVRMLPRWALTNLQRQKLYVELDTVLTLVGEYAVPIFELRYSKALAQLRQTLASDIDGLINADFAGDPEAQIILIENFATKVKAKLELADLDSAEYGTTMAALVIPNPSRWVDRSSTTPGCALLGTCYAAPAAEYRMVELERARAIWDALKNKQVATITVDPADLYTKGGANAQLACTEAAPVIRKMGLYLHTSTDLSIDGLFYRPEMTVAAEQVYPLPTGQPRYVKVDEDWLAMSLPVFGGTNLTDAPGRVRSDPAKVGEGLSPFTTFSVDFRNFPVDTTPSNGISPVQALVLVFELETRPVAQPGVDAGDCR